VFWQRQPFREELVALKELLIEEVGVDDPIDPKIAEVVAQLAPGAEQSDVDIIGHSDRTNRSARTTAVLVDVTDRYFASLTDCIAQL